MVLFLRAKGLAIYKLPERLEVVDKLPVSGGQKISKQDLVKDITQKLRAEGVIT
jgi:cyclohexanecarboxylate-CoA ligase